MSSDWMEIQQATRSFTDLQFIVPAGVQGDFWENSGREALIVWNASGSPVTVTITTPVTVDGNLAVADLTNSVGAGKLAFLGPFSKSIYNDGDGLVKVVCSATSNIKLAVVRIR